MFCKKITPSPLSLIPIGTFCNIPRPPAYVLTCYNPLPPFYVKSNSLFKKLLGVGMQLIIFQKIIYISIFSLYFSYLNKAKYRPFLWNFCSKLVFLGQHALNIFKKQVQNTHFNKTI